MTDSKPIRVAYSNFTCFDAHRHQTDLAYCGFGQYVDRKFEYGEIEDVYFSIEYGGGGTLQGVYGYEDITLAGIEVKHQQVVVALKGHWNGDNVTAGLMGLGYPYLTNAFNGTYGNDTSYDTVPYNPWFFSAVKRGLLPPVFSMALQRSENDQYAGQLAFGGLPELNFTPNFTTVPMHIYNGLQTHPSAYKIDIDGWVVNDVFIPERNNDSASTTYLVDSGHPGLLVSTFLAASINSKYSPPSNFTNFQYDVPCNATTPPEIAVRIAGRDFPIDSRDLVDSAVAGYYPRQTGYCISSFQDGYGASNTLGDAFLRNVVAVFDVGNEQMQFAPHKY